MPNVGNGSIPVVAAASAPRLLFPPTADIAHSGDEGHLLAEAVEKLFFEAMDETLIRR